ncbi:MAG: hypothetical protein ACKODQ_09375 [Betaproteobacteria bacterium]
MRSFILVRRLIVGVNLAGLIGLIQACSPQMDWREVRLDPIGGSALFPGKPVEVSRSLQISGESDAVTLTLRSARIDNTVFAVGWALNGQPGTREKLEAAMLANISAQSAQRSQQTLQDSEQVIHEVIASGQMRLRPDSGPVPARLWMRSLSILPAQPEQGGLVRIIEIIAAGPAQELREEDARLFIESLKLSR